MFKLLLGSVISVVLLTAQVSVENKTLSLSHTALEFNDQKVGQVSTAGSVVITNAGDAPVRFSAVTISGVNASDFKTVKDECTSKYNDLLAPANSCAVSVSFNPSAPGARHASLSFITDGKSAASSVVLSGNGLARRLTSTAPAPAAISADQFELLFGSQAPGTTGAEQTINLTSSGTAAVLGGTLTISGPNASDFVLYTNCGPYAGSFPPAATCAVWITFTPGAPGWRTATLAMTSSAPTVNIALSGIGVTNTGLQISPSVLNFAGPTHTISPIQTVNITNTGTEPLTITNFYFNGPTATDYSITGYICPGGPTLTLLPQITCQVEIGFTASATGNRADTFVLNSTGGTQVVTLNGTGENPAKTLSVTPALNFGAAGIGLQPAPQSVTIQNTGTLPVALSGFALGGGNAGDFLIQPGSNRCLESLPAGQICTVTIVFTPSSTGARTASLVVSDDATGSPHSVALTGAGSPNETSVIIEDAPYSIYGDESTNYDFGDAAVGSSLTNTFGVANTSGANITLTSLATVGPNASDFIITQGYGLCAVGTTVISPYSICSTIVTFLPSGTGLRTAALQITDSTPGGIHSIQLFGYGVAAKPVVSLGSAAYDFGSTNVGGLVQSTANFISNVGSAPFTISNAYFSGTNAADFGIASAQCPGGLELQPQGYCTITFGFFPSGPGLRTATFNIVDDVAATPQTIALSGFGQSAPSAQVISVSPATDDLGFSVVGTAVPANKIRFENSGSKAITLTGLTISGGSATDFQVYSSTCGSTLGPAAFCDVYIQFTPGALGTRIAVLTLANNSTSGPVAVSLIGEDGDVINEGTLNVTGGATLIANESSTTTWTQGGGSANTNVCRSTSSTQNGGFDFNGGTLSGNVIAMVLDDAISIGPGSTGAGEIFVDGRRQHLHGEHRIGPDASMCRAAAAADGTARKPIRSRSPPPFAACRESPTSIRRSRATLSSRPAATRSAMPDRHSASRLTRIVSCPPCGWSKVAPPPPPMTS